MTDLIPQNATEKHIAFLGSTGSGKTSAAKRGLVEPALADKRRVVILDPTGAWWGLRLKADGISKGYSIYIFGGDHGDYPLRARDAALLAETFATSSDSAIFDMSLMTVSERTAFFTEFAETIRRKNKGPLHLIIDEAHLFMPQAGAASGGAVPAMLHAANNLVSLGRSRGLRIALISQRPAKVHKDSLTQVQSLVAMRLLAPQDRKAISDWIADQADPTKGREIIASLPSLKPGEAWVWSPQDDILRHTKFPLPRTFDSSRAPDIADGKGPELAPVNMDALKGRLTALAAETEANSPTAIKALRAKVADLERKVGLYNSQPSVEGEELDAAHADGHAIGYQQGIAAGRQHIVGTLRELETAVLAAVKEAQRLADKAYDDAQAMTAPPLTDRIKRNRHDIPDPRQPSKGTFNRHDLNATHATARAPIMSTKHLDRQSVGRADGNLPRGERACLIAAAQHPNGVTRQQLTVLTGYKRSSRDAYIQRLRERGYIDAGERIQATADGRDALGDAYEPLPTGAALREHVLRTLPEGERKVLEVLISAWPNEVPRDDIDAATGYKRSSRDAYLQRLSARELVAATGGRASAAPTLFD